MFLVWRLLITVNNGSQEACAGQGPRGRSQSAHDGAGRHPRPPGGWGRASIRGQGLFAPCPRRRPTAPAPGRIINWLAPFSLPSLGESLYSFPFLSHHLSADSRPGQGPRDLNWFASLPSPTEKPTAASWIWAICRSLLNAGPNKYSCIRVHFHARAH